jgi:organic radical activating enzyme
MLNLVEFQEPIFETLQGEGTLVGTPSTFVRLWGCDFSCSWCDTKESWRPGSRWVEWGAAAIVAKILEYQNKHVVITGGNPVLQGDDLRGLVMDLRRLGCHVTLETQGSIYHSVMHEAQLLSLSPKLHDWRWQTLTECLSQPRDNAVQFKIVVCTKEEVTEAIHKLRVLREYALNEGYGLERVYCFLQPEYGQGKKWVQGVLQSLKRRQTEGDLVDFIRVLNQVHKGSFGLP